MNQQINKEENKVYVYRKSYEELTLDSDKVSHGDIHAIAPVGILDISSLKQQWLEQYSPMLDNCVKAINITADEIKELEHQARQELLLELKEKVTHLDDGALGMYESSYIPCVLMEDIDKLLKESK